MSFLIAGVKLQYNNPIYAKGNDTYYNTSTKKLYITKFKPTSPVTKDQIFVANLSGGITNGAQYTASNLMNFEYNTEFEIEGFGIYNNNYYASVNDASSNGSSVYHVY